MRVAPWRHLVGNLALAFARMRASARTAIRQDRRSRRRWRMPLRARDATIPAGATVSLEVTSLKRSENANDKIVMEFAVKSVSFGGRTYPVSATVADAAGRPGP